MFDSPVSPTRCPSKELHGDAVHDEGDDVDHLACPHIDRNDTRCGHRFTLGRLDQAFSVCLGGYHGCPTYLRITNELQHPDIEITIRRAPLPLATPALTKLTLNARLPVTSSNRTEAAGPPSIASKFALRRTGT